MTSSKQFQSIQALRGAAAMVVVLFHAVVLSIDYMQGSLYGPWSLVGKAGVDLFFLISGFIMVHTTRASFDTSGAAMRFAIARLARVYPPYWVLSLLVLGYWLYNPAGVNSKTGGVDPVASFLLLPSSSLPLVPVAWTLVHEMFFYLIFFCIIAFGSRRLLMPILASWAALVGLNQLTGNALMSGIGGDLHLSPFNLEFIAGAVLAHIEWRRFGLPALVAGITWFVGLGFWFEAVQHGQLIPGMSRIAIFLPPCVALVYGCLAMERSGWRVPSLAIRLGDWSYSLYLVHILVLHALYRIATKKIETDWSSPLVSLILAAVAVAVSLLVSYGFYRLVEIPSSVYARFWLYAAVRRSKRPLLA